ncbi:MAG: glycosyltransferase family 2 protein [Candidatus Hydrogenedentota bacterium]
MSDIPLEGTPRNPVEPARPVELSVVLTCFNEGAHIATFHDRLSKTLADIGRTYELIYVNDGSADATWEQLCGLFEADPQVAVVADLSRNVGQMEALTAALTYARGAIFVILDTDLQLDPESLPDLLAEYDKGYDLVSGYRPKRVDAHFRRLAALLGNWFIRRVTDTPLTDFGCTFKVIRGNLIRGMNCGPFKPFVPTHLLYHLPRCSEVPVAHHPRTHGVSGNPFWRKAAFALDNLAGLSTRLFQRAGVTFLVLGVLLAAGLPLAWPLLARMSTAIGTALVVLQVFTLGVLLLLGDILLRNHVMIQQIPVYILREVRQRHQG